MIYGTSLKSVEVCFPIMQMISRSVGRSGLSTSFKFCCNFGLAIFHILSAKRNIGYRYLVFYWNIETSYGDCV